METFAQVSNTYENAHEVIKGDPRVDGPYLTDLEEERAERVRDERMKNFKKAEKEAKVAAAKKAKEEAEAKAAEAKKEDAKK